MHRSCASQCDNITEVKWFEIDGILKEKSILTIYDRYPGLQSKWDKASGHDIMQKQLVISLMKQYERVGRGIEKRRFKEYCFIVCH